MSSKKAKAATASAPPAQATATPAKSAKTKSTDVPSTPAKPAAASPSAAAAPKSTKSKRTAAVAAPTQANYPDRQHHITQMESLPVELQNVVRPHLESFNFMLQKGGSLELAVQDIKPQVLDADETAGRPGFKIWFESVQIGYPHKNDDQSADNRLFPNECREGGRSYVAPINATVSFQVDGGPVQQINCNLGDTPIMVKSSRCHLETLTPREMVKRKEEASEMGGYFILNGNERLVRLLIVPRRNYPFALQRSSFARRDIGYTDYAVSIRCTRPDQSSQTVNLHYLSDGTARLRFTHNKQEFFLPVYILLRALVDCTDREIFERVTEGNATGNTFLADRVEILLREGKKIGLLRTRSDFLQFLGDTFRVSMQSSTKQSSEEIGRILLHDYILVHLNSAATDIHSINRMKFNLLIFMLQKLYGLVSGHIKPENPDALSAHELLLPGHFYGIVLKEKLADWLLGMRATIVRDTRMSPSKVQLSNDAYVRKCAQAQPDVGRKMHYLLVTGNLISRTGLDLQQVSGYTIVGEKLNFYRYLAHFRSVHRGQFFAETKTTAVRKLLPDSWGFMCPVHTPDGAPCGLLNHLGNTTVVQTHPTLISRQLTIKVLLDLGMTPIAPAVTPNPTSLSVLFDGQVVGKISPQLVDKFANELRHFKVTNHRSVPRTLEITVVKDDLDGNFPAVYLATNAARMIRPVRFLGTRAASKSNPLAAAANGGLLVELKPFSEPALQGDTTDFLLKHVDTAQYHDIEWIGAMEQVFMEIACTADDFRPGETTHMEIKPLNMLSEIASFTPFSDFNQSPRNMYQCQMGKQTMGTPYHSFPYRTDNKVYRIQTPQTPLVRNETYSKYAIDEYPLGTNAVVAVISYTGYDMEDAMILNKSSYERGFGHASVYKSKFIDLTDKKAGTSQSKFSNIVSKVENGKKVSSFASPQLGPDGLPLIGTQLNYGDPMYCTVNSVTNRAKIVAHKENEPCIVEEVRALGVGADKELQKVCIKLRYNRNPVIGDKFSSRHGQKGVLSRLWPQVDMPFTESGLTPDVIINPHAFPSRMTIGMLVESLAGKAGALHGIFQDGTPFRYNEKERAVDYFGKQLLASGYNYHGNEVMYSGTTGEEFKCDIYIGVVYYQRLRHMVSDKEQVRATGPLNALTRQPIKGRKVHGGIRFGEMERDSLIAHGASFFLNDRLMLCSDYHTTIVCSKCGSLLAPMYIGRDPEQKFSGQQGKTTCRNCETAQHCDTVAVPYVLCYLMNELAAMNIRMTLEIK